LNYTPDDNSKRRVMELITDDEKYGQATRIVADETLVKLNDSYFVHLSSHID
jgi:hypothetical protein